MRKITAFNITDAQQQLLTARQLATKEKLMKSLKVLVAMVGIMMSQTSYADARNIVCRQEKSLSAGASPTIMSQFKVEAEKGWVKGAYYDCAQFKANPVLKGLKSASKNGCLVLFVESKDNSTITIQNMFLDSIEGLSLPWFKRSASGNNEARLRILPSTAFLVGDNTTNGYDSELICEFEK